MKKNESNYECSICMETAKEPIVTKCGHLYCWPCIYDWMETKNSNAECPICKNPISKENMIPIYVKDENASNTDRFKIPNRPKGQRTEKNNQNNGSGNGNANGGPNFNFFGSVGFFPFFGFNMIFNNNNNNPNGYTRHNSPNNMPFTFQNPLNNININNEMKTALMRLITLLFMFYLYALL